MILVLAASTPSDIGIVSHCTLPNAKLIKNIFNSKRKYCAVVQGNKNQSQAVTHCKALNARLPLPKSDAESAAFYREFSVRVWIDITDQGSGPRFL